MLWSIMFLFSVEKKKGNEAVPVTLKVQGNEERQAQQDSKYSSEVNSS